MYLLITLLQAAEPELGNCDFLDPALIPQMSPRLDLAAGNLFVPT